jgi:mycofactocin precursor
VVGFPPFGGLFLLTKWPIISHKKTRQPEKTKHGNRKKQFNQFVTERKIMNDTNIENKDELQQVAIEEQKEKINADIYTTREIEIEEVAIDGICGVY